MKKDFLKARRFLTIILNLSFLLFFTSCNYFENFEKKAKTVNNYHKTALILAKENRELKFQNNNLKTRIKALEAEKNFLEIKLEKKGIKRNLASVKKRVKFKKDYVKQSVYKWKPGVLRAVAQDNFKKKNFIKSSQYFTTLITEYPNYELINDKLLFQAGIAAYESKKYYNWSLVHLKKLVKKYPESPYFRGAKVWIALSHLKLGEQNKFYKIVEEFRLKYRNTQEWKIISTHYEEFNKKFKKQI